jgi:Ni/Co efflux regulator RcnB
MKTLIGAAAIALTLAGASAASAQSFDRGHDDRGGQHQDRQGGDARQGGWDRHGDARQGGDHRDFGGRGDDRRDYGRADHGRDYGYNRYDGGRQQYGYGRQYGYGYGGGNRSWERGDRYSYGGRYVDYRGHGLRRPPHGYRWVQDRNDFLLVALAGGLIAEVIANNY